MPVGNSHKIVDLQTASSATFCCSERRQYWQATNISEELSGDCGLTLARIRLRARFKRSCVHPLSHGVENTF